MNRQITLTIPGQPASQGSKNYYGPGRAVETDKNLPAWRRTVATIARDQLGTDWPPMDGPLKVEAVFYLPRPAKPKFDEPATPKDLDKYCRSLGDSLTQAGVIVDDARIVHWDARKVYATQTVGCIVTITERD